MKLALLVLLVASCSDHDKPKLQPDPERHPRAIEPPSGRPVRALPPHAIRADGVGPYRLGASLAELLDQLPSGPRIALFEIPGVVHRSILRAEDDAILIGGEPLGRASFVAVVGGEVARTESGIHIGSTREEVSRALGPPVEEPDTARDPRLIVPSGLRNARLVIDRDRVVAMVVSDAGPRASAEVGDCARPTPDPEKVTSAHAFGACLTPAGERVDYEGDEISVVNPESQKLVAQLRLSGLVFAAPLRGPEGRDELVAVARSDDAQARTWSLVVYRLDGGRLVKVVEPTPLYALTASNARWIGAELRDLDLYLELTSRPDAIEVGGLLTTRIGDKIRDIVVISQVPVARRRAKSASPEVPDAGTSEGGESAGATHPHP